jgi:DNA polymerase-3 subunit delta
MLLQRDAFLAALQSPDPAIRLWLVFGRSEEDSLALADAAAKALGGDILDLKAADLVDSPGLLKDEAASLPMFGGRPLIRVLGADNRLAAAAEGLLESGVTGNPVLMLAGDLAKTGALPTLATRHPLARAVAAWGLDAREGKAAVLEAARAAGLRLDADGVARLWAAAQGSLMVLARETEKLALYLCATPQAPMEVSPDVLDRLLAGDETEDFARLVRAVFTGDRKALDQELQVAPSPIPLFRGLMPRLLSLLELSDAVAAGKAPSEAVAAARPPIFWKEKEMMTRALRDWQPARIRAAITMLLAAERAIKSTGSAGDRLGRHALLMVALPPAAGPVLGRGARRS